MYEKKLNSPAVVVGGGRRNFGEAILKYKLLYVTQGFFYTQRGARVFFALEAPPSRPLPFSRN